ncbi:MAG: hypothetical protein WCC54_28065, partial [Pseudolabrys sp.]
AMSALPPRADMCGATRDVRFVPIADIAHLLGASETIVVFTSTGAAGCAEIPLVGSKDAIGGHQKLVDASAMNFSALSVCSAD